MLKFRPTTSLVLSITYAKRQRQNKNGTGKLEFFSMNKNGNGKLEWNEINVLVKMQTYF